MHFRRRSSNSDLDEERETPHIPDRNYSGTATFIALFCASFVMAFAGVSAYIWYGMPAAVAIPAILVMTIPIGLPVVEMVDLFLSALH